MRNEPSRTGDHAQPVEWRGPASLLQGAIAHDGRLELTPKVVRFVPTSALARQLGVQPIEVNRRRLAQVSVSPDGAFLTLHVDGRLHRFSGKSFRRLVTLLEIAQEAALQRRRHVWVDGSLRDGDWYEAEFKRIQQAHPDYKIAIVHVVASRAAVQQRVQSRAAVTGRHVPEHEVDDSILRVPKSVRRLAPFLDFLAVIDNSAEVPHLVEYCDEQGCNLCLDDWVQLSERWGLTDKVGVVASVDECELAPGGEGEWEEVSKNFELARRTSQSGAAEDEWG